jgi:hypothetical protein
MTPAFFVSVRLLLDLHELFLRGEAQGPEANAVRDTMERPWYDMTDDQQRRVEQLSADLYTIGERTEGEPPGDDLRTSFDDAIGAEDWENVLTLLQEHPGLALPAKRSRLRAQAWEALGVPEAAAAFSEDARRALSVVCYPPRGAVAGDTWRLVGAKAA